MNPKISRVNGDIESKRARAVYRNKIRSPTDNYHEILKVVHDGEKVLNRILYRVALPWKRGKEMINDLVAKGYLIREKVSAARYGYKITDEGVKAMKKYESSLENMDILD